MKQRLTRRDVWIRALNMVLFGIAYSVAEVVIAVVVVVQFFFVLLAGRANDNLLAFGANLSAYVREVFRFETFNTETLPFPIGDWPDEPPGGEVWTVDDEPVGPMPDENDTVGNLSAPEDEPSGPVETDADPSGR